jgi:XapX domain-containing protein
MKPMLISFLVGLVVGAIYALLRVRSPAPPLIALAGLLGMVWGEQLVQQVLARKASEPAKTARRITDNKRTMASAEGESSYE